MEGGFNFNHCISTLTANEQTHQGVAKVEANKEYINKNGYNGSLFDEFIVKMTTNVGGGATAFFDELSKFLVRIIAPSGFTAILRVFFSA